MSKKTLYRVGLACCCALLLTGCVKTAWVHPSKSASDFQQDRYECEQTATQAACNWRACGNPFVIADELKRCLHLRYGWTLTRVQ